MRLILYSKPGCHLCEGLQEKLEQVQGLNFQLEIRDITTREDWFNAYQYEVPVLTRDATGGEDGISQVSPNPVEELLPRPSPRVSVQQLQLLLQKYFPANATE